MHVKLQKYLLKTFIGLLLAALAGISFSCDPIAGTVSDKKTVSVSVRQSEKPAEAGSVFVSVKTDASWSLSLDFGGSEPWAEIDVDSGVGEKNDIFLNYDANTTDGSRVLTIKAVTSFGSAVCTFTQLAGAGTDDPGTDPLPGEIASDPVAGWLELPAVNSADGKYYFAHYQTIGGKTLRSWSYQWNMDALVADWVAYPLNESLIGSGSRTDEWGLDPKLPEDCQPVLYKGYKGGYDRGHQLPSADRLNYAANVQTFYGTNMTPQLGQLNQRSWADLENQVRDWARSMDTLYVVTGCTQPEPGEETYAYDNVGKAITVPSGYYKALLGYKKGGTIGITSTTGGYTACAFYFDHEGYSGDFMRMAMTIDELEAITGIDFFVNLPETIAQSLADKVESTKDTWWY